MFERISLDKDLVDWRPERKTPTRTAPKRSTSPRQAKRLNGAVSERIKEKRGRDH
jgi:hypothetical protein